MKFNYARVVDNHDPKGYILLPMLRVRLFYQGNHDDLRCLLDTGADDCMFHASVARNLGINLTSGEPKTYFAVNGQPFQAYMHTVEMRIHRTNQRIRIKAGFAEDCEDSLLGESGFFDSFEVTFRRYRGEFEVKPRPHHH